MKRSIAIILSAVMLTGCSLRDVNVEKRETATQNVPAANGAVSNTESGGEENTNSEASAPETDEPEIKLRPELGEKFLPYTIVDSGGYLTVDSAEIFHNLKEAGINEDEANLFWENGEPFEQFNRFTKEEGPVYDKATGDILNDFSIVKIHFTFENVNAVSKVNEFIALPEERYDDDVFSVGVLQLCDADDSAMITQMNYYCYLRFYFSLENTIDYTTVKHNGLFRCPPGEKVEFDIAYLFDCDPEHLNLAITSGNKTDTMVDLKLGDDR